MGNFRLIFNLLFQYPSMINSKKKSNMDLYKHLHKLIKVKFQGGREILGKLEGFDQFCNLILDDAREFLRDPVDQYSVTNRSRALGLMVCRGATVVAIFAEKGSELIENPWNL